MTEESLDAGLGSAMRRKGCLLEFVVCWSSSVAAGLSERELLNVASMEA